MARIKINGEATSRTDVSNRTGKPYTITTQPATIETAFLRLPFELDLPNLEAAKAPGTEWDWNPEADITAGRYGPELKRFMTLTPRKAA
jgi:hypothetical protein